MVADATHGFTRAIFIGSLRESWGGARVGMG